MSFNAKKSGVKDARTELGLLQQWVSDCNARCAEVNTSFGAVMMGSWADAEISAAVQLQTYLLIYADALGAMHETYDSMIGDLDGTLSTRRDAVLESVKASTGNDDVVHFEDSGAVTSGCSTVQDALTALDTQRAGAQGALAGLENSGAIAAALDALGTAIQNENEAVEKVRTSYTDYQDAVEEFESEFAGALAIENFITDDMLSNASDAMSAQFEGTPVAGFIGSAADFKKNYLKPVKTTLDNLAKPLAEIDPENAVALWKSFKSVALEGNFYQADELVDSLDMFLTNGGGKGGYWSKYWDDLTGFLRPSQYASQANKITGAFDFTTSGSRNVLYLDDMAQSVDDFADVTARTGTVLKSSAKYLGYAGDFIELGCGLMDASNAYQTTVGDQAQKSAAAVVTGGGALLKFGAGKAAGALIGTCLGGPLGAVVGIGIGCVIDEGAKALGNFFNESGITQSITDGLAWLFRGGKEDDSAFAPA